MWHGSPASWAKTAALILTAIIGLASVGADFDVTSGDAGTSIRLLLPR
jgi:hypothetical protein